MPRCADMKLHLLGRLFIDIRRSVISRFRVFAKSAVAQSEQRVIRLRFQLNVVTRRTLVVSQRRRQIIVLGTHLDGVAQRIDRRIFLLFFQLAFLGVFGSVGCVRGIGCCWIDGGGGCGRAAGGKCW